MTDEQIADWKLQIDQMSREEMCRLCRFAHSGHPCFVIGTPVTDYFRKKLGSLGGFSPEISKKVEWEQ